MGLDRLIIVGLGLVLALAGCDSGGSTSRRLLYGETAQELASVHGSVIAMGRVLDAATLGRRFTSCSPGGAVNGTVIVERIGVFGESLTFADAAGKTLYSCDGGTDPTRERRPPWCGGSSGRLLHGRLLDPRLDILCHDHEGRPLAYAWIEPVPGARWIGVDQGSYTEVYEVLARFPVRVATAHGIQLARNLRSDAVRHGRKSAGRGAPRGGSRRLNSALDSAHSVGADLADGDHEDPHPLPVLGRLLGDQIGATPRPARRARGGFG